GTVTFLVELPRGGVVGLNTGHATFRSAVVRLSTSFRKMRPMVAEAHTIWAVCELFAIFCVAYTSYHTVRTTKLRRLRLFDVTSSKSPAGRDLACRSVYFPGTASRRSTSS